VDLQSTDEEEEPATGPEGKKASATKVEPKVEVEGGEDEDEEEDVDAGKGRGGGGKGQQGGRGGKAAGEEADTTVLATLEAEEGAPVIETASLPARLDASDAKEEVGKVLSIVDGLVVVQGGIDNKALDLQSVICLEDGFVVGAVVDVFGPITLPHYLIYANAKAQELVKPGMPAYAATCLQETSFLCDTDDIDALRKRLGDEESDDDSEFVDGDISDDGEEAAWGPAGAAALEAA
ncbi:unnamed protein product, partial [Polarella glacialis]